MSYLENGQLTANISSEQRLDDDTEEDLQLRE